MSDHAAIPNCDPLVRVLIKQGGTMLLNPQMVGPEPGQFIPRRRLHITTLLCSLSSTSWVTRRRFPPARDPLRHPVESRRSASFPGRDALENAFILASASLFAILHG